MDATENEKWEEKISNMPTEQLESFKSILENKLNNLKYNHISYTNPKLFKIITKINNLLLFFIFGVAGIITIMMALYPKIIELIVPYFVPAIIIFMLPTVILTSFFSDSDIKKLTKKVDDINFLLKSRSTEKYYSSNSKFNIFLDLKHIFSNAKNNIFIVDAYIDMTLFEHYLSDLNKNIKIQILTKNQNDSKFNKFTETINKFFGEFPCEIKVSTNFHDRHIFIDEKEGYTLGGSIKDAGNKPGFITKITANKFSKVYQEYKNLFDNGEFLIK